MSLLDRLLGLVGLDFDFDLDATSAPFHGITPTLTLGARPRPEQLDALQELGVTHVVSCLEPEEQELVRFLEDHFETLFLPLRDGMDQDIAPHIETFLSHLDRHSGHTYVHCQVGVSRSATLTTAHVMQTRQLRFLEAYRHVRQRRPQVLPNVGFASQLQRFEHQLFEAPREGYSSLTRYLHEVCNVPVEIELLDEMVRSHDFDGIAAVRAVFGDEIPRVVQGVRR